MHTEYDDYAQHFPRSSHWSLYVYGSSQGKDATSSSANLTGLMDLDVRRGTHRHESISRDANAVALYNKYIDFEDTYMPVITQLK